VGRRCVGLPRAALRALFTTDDLIVAGANAELSAVVWLVILPLAILSFASGAA
jgi:hypothetical protein